MRAILAIRAVVVVVAVLVVGAAAGEFPLVPVVAIALIAAIVGIGEVLIALREPPADREKTPSTARREALLDTSTLIDGRLAEIVESGFLDLDLIVPEFVLRELQHVADAPDALRRARGRRGLDTLAGLRASSRIACRVVDDDVSGERSVDLKLVALAGRRNAALITTDFNLNKIAGIKDVAVLNVNDLAHAVRPVVLPGERLRVTIVKDGKEAGQGVAYLEDGTMIVVENGRGATGRTIDVVVTSAIQTAAGKMFFAKPAEG